MLRLEQRTEFQVEHLLEKFFLGAEMVGGELLADLGALRDAEHGGAVETLARKLLRRGIEDALSGAFGVPDRSHRPVPLFLMIIQIAGGPGV